MSVKLISVTKPIGELGDLTPEELIVYIARVSNPDNQLNIETTPKLLKYCLDHKHFSIFEQVSMTVEITTSRAIATQLLRHKSFCFQEYSQRYAKAKNYVKHEARRQDLKNRQNSINDLDEETKEWFNNIQENVFDLCEDYYLQALDKGIAKEQARVLLPLSTETKLYMTGSIRSFIHYIQVRTDNSTQKEHRDIASAIKHIFIGNFPNIANALEWY